MKRHALQNVSGVKDDTAEMLVLNVPPVSGQDFLLSYPYFSCP